MRREELIELITAEIYRAVKQSTKQINKQTENQEALEVLKKYTPARIGFGKSGPRLTTATMLKLREDHAKAKDAVLKSVDEELISQLGLFSIKTECVDIDQHLTRPDIGRTLGAESVAVLREKCIKSPQVQIYVSDGLSSSAVNENARDILPVMMDGLKRKNVKVGTPFFLKYGRVPTMDKISEILDAEVTCVLIGERPGLMAADSMSAYIVYKAFPGMPESRRTVISNIHAKGIQPVEAGAYAVDVILKMLTSKQSGVDLKL